MVGGSAGKKGGCMPFPTPLSFLTSSAPKNKMLITKNSTACTPSVHATLTISVSWAWAAAAEADGGAPLARPVKG